ncbi:MAG: ZIP family metal transporter [Chloroflexota bacterium]
MPLAAFLPFFTTLAGGVVALRLRHRIHIFMALAAGVVVATAITELLPEAYDLVGSGSALAVGIAALVGFVAFSLIEAFIHQTSFEHSRDAHPSADRIGSSKSAGTGSLLGMLPPISLILHSALDGLAIGFGFQAGATIGFVVLLAVLAHDFADGMNVVTLALEAARGERLAVGLLILDALAPLAGAALSTLVAISPSTLGLLLAWFAGVFLAIGAGHLLPEAQHEDPRQGPFLVALFGLGAAIVVGIRAASV